MRKEQQRENLFVFVVRCLQWTTVIERTFTTPSYDVRYGFCSFFYSFTSTQKIFKSKKLYFLIVIMYKINFLNHFYKCLYMVIAVFVLPVLIPILIL